MNTFALWLCRIKVFLYSLWCRIISYLGMEQLMDLSGEICVSGSSVVFIQLDRKEAPSVVIVAFKDEHRRHHHRHPCNHPCNHHQNLLDWQLNDNPDGSHTLSIEYDVEGIQEIVWEVVYESSSR